VPARAHPGGALSFLRARHLELPVVTIIEHNPLRAAISAMFGGHDSRGYLYWIDVRRHAASCHSRAHSRPAASISRLRFDMNADRRARSAPGKDGSGWAVTVAERRAQHSALMLNLRERRDELEA
jgi:hypothetical protein